MKHQALFSSKDKSKTIKCRLLQFLFGTVRVNMAGAYKFFRLKSGPSILNWWVSSALVPMWIFRPSSYFCFINVMFDFMFSLVTHFFARKVSTRTNQPNNS